MSEEFTASVQYDDWKGTAAADGSDHISLHTFFRERGVPEGGFVVAVRSYYLPSSPGKMHVRAVYADGDGFDSVNEQIQSADKLRLKELDLELTFEEYFSLFKRYNVVLTSKGLGLDGREYEIQNG